MSIYSGFYLCREFSLPVQTAVGDTRGALRSLRSLDHETPTRAKRVSSIAVVSGAGNDCETPFLTPFETSLAL